MGHSADAAVRLEALGPLTRQETIVLVAFAGMVALWAAAMTLASSSAHLRRFATPCRYRACATTASLASSAR